jgi:antitoxin HicB
VSEKLHYSMVVQWSSEDQAYLVTLPEWEGRVVNPVTHGDTYEEAIKSGHEALEALIASASKHSEPLPAPHMFAGELSGGR